MPTKTITFAVGDQCGSQQEAEAHKADWGDIYFKYPRRWFHFHGRAEAWLCSWACAEAFVRTQREKAGGRP